MWFLRQSAHADAGAASARPQSSKFARAGSGAALIATLAFAQAEPAAAQSGAALVGAKPAASRQIHTVQAKTAASPRLIVDVSIQGKAGDKLKFPARLEPAAPDTPQFIMLHQVPTWLKVVGGEAVGNGVWLVPAKAIGAAELQLEANATGRQEIVVSLLSPNGSDVLSESRLIVNAAASTTAGAPTWQSLVGGSAPTTPPPAANRQVLAAAPVTATTDGTDADLVQYARHLVRECTTCHSLFGTDVGIPVMVGLSRDRFIETMSLYRTGRRDHGPMKAVAESLDERETLALALYLSRIRPETEQAAAAAATQAPTPAATGTASIAPARATTTEKPDRIERWIQRGQELLRSGDVSQGRLMLERAAEHGSPVGAYLLGTSYDPNVLPWRPGMGIEAEPARARSWYLHAKTLGDIPEADSRLADLR